MQVEVPQAPVASCSRAMLYPMLIFCIAVVSVSVIIDAVASCMSDSASSKSPALRRVRMSVCRWPGGRVRSGESVTQNTAYLAASR